MQNVYISSLQNVYISKICAHTVSKLGDNPSKYVMELERYYSGQEGLNVIRKFNTEELLSV